MFKVVDCGCGRGVDCPSLDVKEEKPNVPIWDRRTGEPWHGRTSMPKRRKDDQLEDLLEATERSGNPQPQSLGEILAEALAAAGPLDDISNPGYYKRNGMEAIDVIEAFELGYHKGSAFKYLARAGQKGPAVDDLRKAQWFIQREIERLQRG